MLRALFIVTPRTISNTVFINSMQCSMDQPKTSWVWSANIPERGFCSFLLGLNILILIHTYGARIRNKTSKTPGSSTPRTYAASLSLHRHEWHPFTSVQSQCLWLRSPHPTAASPGEFVYLSFRLLQPSSLALLLLHHLTARTGGPYSSVRL